MFVWGFLLASLGSYSNNLSYAQNKKFTFEFKSVNIKTVLQYIEANSEFIFAYRSNLFDTAKPVSVKVKDQSIEETLEQLLKGTSMTYTINDRQILLKKGFFVTFGAVKYATCLYLWPMPAYLRE